MHPDFAIKTFSESANKEASSKTDSSGGVELFTNKSYVWHQHATYFIPSCSLDLGEHYQYPQHYVSSNRKILQLPEVRTIAQKDTFGGIFTYSRAHLCGYQIQKTSNSPRLGL